MLEVTVVRSVAMGHRLPFYNGLCSSLHGHNIKVKVTVVIEETQFLDYKFADKILAEVLEPFDHAMVFGKDDAALPLFLDFIDACDNRAINLNQRLVILSEAPTTEIVASYLFQKLSETLTVSEVTVHETDKYSSTAWSVVSHTQSRRIERYAPNGEVML